MEQLKKLNATESQQLIHQASCELENRKRIESLNKDIRKLISKHMLTKAEIAVSTNILNAIKISAKSKARAVAKVPPKYRNPRGSETWTGRG